MTHTDNELLIKRYSQGEKELEQQIVELNMGLVRSTAHRFARSGAASYCGADYEDLVQIGSIGLLKALRNFDVERGLMFSTYAVPVIIGEIRRFLRDDGPVKVSRSIKEQYAVIRREKERLQNTLLREPTLSEISEATGFTREEIVFASDAGGRPASIDDTLTEDGDISISDRLTADDPIAYIDILALKEGISNLGTEDRKLLSLRYFLAKTQQETANIMGMTQVQVSRKEKKIMQQLRERIGQ